MSSKDREYTKMEAGDAGGVKGGDPAHAAKVLFAVVAYGTCSSTMLIVNKVAVHYLPAPSVVLFCQLATAAVVVKGCDTVGVLKADAFEWEKVKKFALVILAFLGALFTNVKTLQYSNVETFIVFRSSTPIIIAFMDYMFLGRALPNFRSWCSLGTILVGALLYVYTDSDFEVAAYVWVGCWYVVFVFDQVYIKYVCDTVPMTSWGRVLYTNALTLIPLTFVGVIARDDQVMADFEWTTESVAALLVSCAIGVGMSYSAFLLRALVSATSFTVVGIMCKIATVVINLVIWDKHASPTGLLALSLCLAAGTIYQQAPLREEQAAKASL